MTKRNSQDGPDLVQLYRRSLPPMLRNKDAADLLRQFRSLRDRGDDYTAIRNRVVEGYLRLAYSVATRRKYAEQELLDAVQIANEALLNAVDRVDPEHPALHLYFSRTIRNALRQAHVRNDSPVSGLSATVLHRMATRPELVGDETRVRALNARKPAVRLSEPVRDESGYETEQDLTSTIADEHRILADGTFTIPRFAAPDSGLERDDLRQQVRQLLDNAVPPLTDDERAVFTTMRDLVDGIERDAAETAHILNLSAVRTRQLADQGLKKVKRGAFGEREFSIPEVANLDRAAEGQAGSQAACPLLASRCFRRGRTSAECSQKRYWLRIRQPAKAEVIDQSVVRPLGGNQIGAISTELDSAIA